MQPTPTAKSSREEKSKTITKLLIDQIRKNSSSNLDLQEKDVTAKDFAEVVAPVLVFPECKFTSIDIGHNNLGDEGASSFAAILRNSANKLTTANLAWNYIGEKGSVEIAYALQNSNCKLTALDLRWNRVGIEGAIAIATALGNPNCKLTSINLDWNNIGPEGARIIVKSVISRKGMGRPIEVVGIGDIDTLIAEVEQEEKLWTLRFSSTEFERVKTLLSTESGTNQSQLSQSAATSTNASTLSAVTLEEKHSILEVEKKSTIEQEIRARARLKLIHTKQLIDQAIKDSLIELDLSDSGILLAEEVRAIAAALQSSNCKLTEINISDNDIGAEGIKVIATALQSPNCKLTAVNIAGNEIGSEGAIAIAAALQISSCKLTSIYLPGNKIGSEGAIAIAAALQSSNCKLTKINIAGNEIGSEGAIAITAALQSSSCKLTSIDLSGNEIGSEDARVIATALQSPNCTLTRININSNTIGLEGIRAIATALQSPHCKLTEIDIGYNNIGSEGAIAIAAALQSPHCKLTEIDIGYNNIGSKGAIAIAAALQSSSCKLTSISFEYIDTGLDGSRAIAAAIVARKKIGRPIEVRGIPTFDTLMSEIEQEEKRLESKLRFGSTTNSEQITTSSSTDSGTSQSQLLQSAASMSTNATATALRSVIFEEKHSILEAEKKSTTEQEATDRLKQLKVQPLSEQALKDNAATLNLYNNDIGPEQAIAVAKALQESNSEFTAVDLEDNNIGLEGVRAIATALQNPNCKLTSINLAGNNIGSEGAKIIAAALLNHNCKLGSIDLAWNNLELDGAKAITTAILFRKKSGRPIMVTGINDLDTIIATVEQEEKEREAKLKLELALEEKSNLEQKTEVKAKVKPVEIRQCIAQALKDSATELDLRGDDVGTEGTIAIANVLQNPNCKFTSIDLSGNAIGSVGAQAIANAVVLRKLAGRPINVIGINDFATLVADESLARAGKLMIIEPDLKQALQILVQDLQVQNSSQKLQQLIYLVAIVTPPIGQALSEEQLKAVTATFTSTLASIKDSFPYKAALLEAQFNINRSKLLCTDSKSSEPDLKQANLFAQQALQILKAINFAATTKNIVFKTARKNREIIEVQSLIAAIQIQKQLKNSHHDDREQEGKTTEHVQRH